MFLGPVYLLANNGVTISTAISALQLKVGANGVAELLRASLTQGTSTTSTQFAAGVIRKSAAATVTQAIAGTTLKKMNPASPTADATISTTATGITASAEGTNTDLTIQRGINILNGWEWLPTPEERMIVPIAGFCAVTFLTAPPSATWYAELVYRELRGA